MNGSIARHGRRWALGLAVFLPGAAADGGGDAPESAEQAPEIVAARQKLSFPIVVDHPDGRILERYKSVGVSGYPSFVLIDSRGDVIARDGVISGLSLRGHKIEIVRELLLSAKPASR